MIFFHPSKKLGKSEMRMLELSAETCTIRKPLASHQSLALQSITGFTLTQSSAVFAWWRNRWMNAFYHTPMVPDDRKPWWIHPICSQVWSGLVSPSLSEEKKKLGSWGHWYISAASIVKRNYLNSSWPISPWNLTIYFFSSLGEFKVCFELISFWLIETFPKRGGRKGGSTKFQNSILQMLRSRQGLLKYSYLFASLPPCIL